MKRSEELNACIGVIDAQGYSIDKTFYPVELAVVGDGFNHSYPLSTELKLDSMSLEDKRNCNFVRNNIHGIPLMPLGAKFLCKYTSLQVEVLICQIYMMLSDRAENVVLGCRNPQLAAILRGMGAEFVDLSRRGFNTPTLKDLDKSSGEDPWFCSFHTRLPCCYEEDRKEFRCSLRKCVYLWNWIKDQVKANTKKEAELKLTAALRQQAKDDNGITGTKGLHLRWSLVMPDYDGKPYLTSPLAFQSYADCMDDYVSYFQQGHDIVDSLNLKMIINFEGLDNYLTTRRHIV